MKKVVLAASLAATMLSSAVFASVNAKEGSMNVSIRGQGIFKEGKQGVSKKRGYGAEIEAAYFLTNEFASVVAIGYNQLSSRKPDAIASGVKARYIPVKLGFQYHITNPNGFNPYFGAGVQYVKGNYKVQGGVNGTMKKRSLYGAYLQTGFNHALSDTAALDFDVQKSFMKRHATYIYNAGANTNKIKYTPVTVSLGATFNVN